MPCEVPCEVIELTVQLTEIYVDSIVIGFGIDGTYCVSIARAATDGTCQVQDI